MAKHTTIERNFNFPFKIPSLEEMNRVEANGEENSIACDYDDPDRQCYRRENGEWVPWPYTRATLPIYDDDAVARGEPTKFYIHVSSGNDANDGLTPATAFLTAAPVSAWLRRWRALYRAFYVYVSEHNPASVLDFNSIPESPDQEFIALNIVGDVTVLQTGTFTAARADNVEAVSLSGDTTGLDRKFLSYPQNIGTFTGLDSEGFILMRNGVASFAGGATVDSGAEYAIYEPNVTVGYLRVDSGRSVRVSNFTAGIFEAFDVHKLCITAIDALDARLDGSSLSAGLVVDPDTQATEGWASLSLTADDTVTIVDVDTRPDLFAVAGGIVNLQSSVVLNSVAACAPLFASETSAFRVLGSCELSGTGQLNMGGIASIDGALITPNNGTILMDVRGRGTFSVNGALIDPGNTDRVRLDNTQSAIYTLGAYAGNTSAGFEGPAGSLLTFSHNGLYLSNTGGLDRSGLFVQRRPHSTATVTLYVDYANVNASDNNLGTAAAPFKTLLGVQKYIEQWKQHTASILVNIVSNIPVEAGPQTISGFRPGFANSLIIRGGLVQTGSAYTVSSVHSYRHKFDRSPTTSPSEELGVYARFSQTPTTRGSLIHQLPAGNATTLVEVPTGVTAGTVTFWRSSLAPNIAPYLSIIDSHGVIVDQLNLNNLYVKDSEVLFCESLCRDFSANNWTLLTPFTTIDGNTYINSLAISRFGSVVACKVRGWQVEVRNTESGVASGLNFSKGSVLEQVSAQSYTSIAGAQAIWMGDESVIGFSMLSLMRPMHVFSSRIYYHEFAEFRAVNTIDSQNDIQILLSDGGQSAELGVCDRLVDASDAPQLYYVRYHSYLHLFSPWATYATNIRIDNNTAAMLTVLGADATSITSVLSGARAYVASAAGAAGGVVTTP